MTHFRSEYIHPRRYEWLAPSFDPLFQRATRNRALRRQFVEQAHIDDDHRVLIIGCGAATLMLQLECTHSGSEFIGFDGDPNILAVAGREAIEANLDISLNEGMSCDLPYPEESFSRVFCCLVFHHLTQQINVRTYSETIRVRHPRGELDAADWGKARDCFVGLALFQVQLLDGSATTHDNVKGMLPRCFTDADFERVEEATRWMTVFGTLSLYRARKP